MHRGRRLPAAEGDRLAERDAVHHRHREVGDAVALAGSRASGSSREASSWSAQLGLSAELLREQAGRSRAVSGASRFAAATTSGLGRAGSPFQTSCLAPLAQPFDEPVGGRNRCAGHDRRRAADAGLDAPRSCRSDSRRAKRSSCPISIINEHGSSPVGSPKVFLLLRQFEEGEKDRPG